MNVKTLIQFTPVAVLGAIALLNLQAKDNPDDKWAKQRANLVKPVEGDQKSKIDEALPTAPTAQPKKARKILVFWRCGGFVHSSIRQGNYALETVGKNTKAFSADLSDDYAVFTKENLAQYDLVLFNNTTHLQFPEESMREALLDFLSQGKGVAGLHAASDNFYKWKEGAEIMGGQFAGHPWGAGGKWAFQLDDPEHPVNKAFDGKGFWHTDEIYQYKKETYEGAKKLRLLVSLDMSKKEVNEKIKDGPRQVPVSWVREYNGGRVFYTNFGHREDTFANPTVLRHMLDGIQYALGDLEADATPTGDNPGAPAPAPEK